MWLKDFLLHHGFKLGKENQRVISAKTISQSEYSFLMGCSCEQLRIQEEVLLHSGAFHAAEYLRKAIQELELLQDMIDEYQPHKKDHHNDKSKHPDLLGAQRAKVLKFNETRPA